MEISLTALEIVLLLLNNYFVIRSKDPVFWVYNVLMCFPLNTHTNTHRIASSYAIGICSFFRKSPPYTPLNVATEVQGAL